MAIHKVSLDEFEEVEYAIIAIHTAMEDYRLAYAINLALQINLRKSPKEILVQIKEGESFFSRFTFFETSKDIYWHLIQNKKEVIQTKNSSKSNLFLDQNIAISVQTYLIPELKKADFFLKIEASQYNFDSTEIITRLNNITAINMAYSIETEYLKSKNNLIF